MGIELVRYHEEWRGRWDDFVAHSLNGTLLHTRSFFDHNPLNAVDDCSFLFVKGGKIVALLPACLYTDNGKNILHAHKRATYGGFVVNSEIGVSQAYELVDQLVKTARELMVDEIIIRNSFSIFHKCPCDETDYAMWRHGFKIKSREIETVIPLAEDTLPDLSYSGPTKRSVRRGNTFVQVMESNRFEDFWPVLAQNLETKHNLRPVHSLDEILKLRDSVGAEKIKLFAAMRDQKIIAGVILFVVNDRVIQAQYIASDSAYQEYRPLNALIDYVIRWGSGNNFKYLNLGTSNTEGGKGINAGLFKFKEGFGGRGTLRETMHLLL